jgi:uncharacterized protein DUF3551
MRISLALAIPLVLVIPTQETAAQNYPWCTAGSYKDGARDCGFQTYEQCMAAVRGAGGYCEQNQMYRATVGASPSPHKPRAKPAR